MPGKSALLRSIGPAAILAFAGATVRALSLRLAVMRNCASTSIVDFFQEGRSKFLAEMQRLREMLQTLRRRPQRFFLVDEIFSRTNSRGANLHMGSREGSDNPLDFDYKLKPGVTTESNALAIARMVGVPV